MLDFAPLFSYQCIFSNCESTSDQTNIKFYSIPKFKKFAIKKLAEFSRLRRNKWLKVIGGEVNPGARVCSKHFQKGKPSTLTEIDQPNWAPNLNLGKARNEFLLNPIVEEKRKYRLKEVAICRMCLEESQECELIPLFTSTWADMPIIELVNFATPLVVLEKDDCPDSICKSCFRKVKIAYQLKKDCLQTNEIVFGNLPSSYQKPTVEGPEIEDYQKFLDLDRENNFQDSFIYTMDKKETVKPKKPRHYHIIEFENYEVLDETPTINYSIQETEEPVMESQAIEEIMLIDEEIPYETEAERTRLALEELKRNKYTGKCYLCDLEFHVKGEKKSHILTHHSDQTQFDCPKCTFSSKSFRVTNDKHMKLHFQAIVCEQCGESFSLQSQLEVHLITNHTSQEEKEKMKQKECPICAKKFLFQATLTKHIKTHSDNKNYSCNVCQQRFTSKISMERHKLVHGFEPKYICSNKNCLKGFVVPNELLRHMEKCGK
jgi:hypothetical protein